MPVTTILSPHPDDAVLSLWGTLAGPGDVRVINLFTGSPNGRPELGWWDRMTGADDAASRGRERLAEDEQALGLLGRAAVNLRFLDRQYRDRKHPIGSLLEEVTDAVPGDALVMAPAALSSHRDHVQARDVALELQRRGMGVTLYADLPHATTYGWPASVTGGGTPAYLDPEVYWETKLAGTGASVGEPSVRALTEVELRRKLEAVRCYRTQVRALDEQYSILSRPDVLRYEVLWPLPPSGGRVRAKSP